MNIYERVVQGVKWHAFESIIYQIVLCSHRFALYKVLGPAVFGELGCIFATVYGLIFLSNMGFNDGIIAFFSEISSCKNSCKRFFLKQSIIHLFILIALPLLLCFFPFHSLLIVPRTVLFAAIALFIAESLHSTLRMLLQLTFINKELTCIDLGGLCFYLITVWSLWLYGMLLTPCMIIIPLALISCFQVLTLSFYALSWYSSLPIKHTSAFPSYKRILRVRLFSYMHHTLSSHFMGNFIVPYSAYMWGLEYASFVKLLSSASQLITTLLKHTIGFSSMALFSHFKHASHTEKKSIFLLINKFLFGTLFASVALCSTFYVIAKPYVDTTPVHSALIILLFIVFIFEGCFMTCESAYLSEEKPEVLGIIYTISASIIYILFHYQTKIPTFLLASSLLVVRIFSLCTLTFLLTNRWKSSHG